MNTKEQENTTSPTVLTDTPMTPAMLGVCEERGTWGGEGRSATKFHGTGGYM